MYIIGVLNVDPTITIFNVELYQMCNFIYIKCTSINLILLITHWRHRQIYNISLDIITLLYRIILYRYIIYMLSST